MKSPTKSGAKTRSKDRRRCAWVSDDPLYVSYHDHEWGVPTHDDASLFELLTLEGAQAGLSWLTVLRRREGYRRVFRHFDAADVARFSDADLERILRDEGVIRHRKKIESVRTNARAIVEVQRQHRSFDAYLWDLGTGAGPPAAVATHMATTLRRDGFHFVGPTICHSLRQASGMLNGHDATCFLFRNVHSRDANSR